MRLIDADELKKKLKLWAFNNVTTTSPTFDFVTEFDIDECPTVDVLEQISDEIRQIVDEETKHDETWARGLHYALCIIEKHWNCVARMVDPQESGDKERIKAIPSAEPNITWVTGADGAKIAFKDVPVWKAIKICEILGAPQESEEQTE